MLVTGAGGFIASHLVERLVQVGASVRALVRYQSMGSWGWLDRSSVRDQIDVVAGDVTDRDCVYEAMQDVDVVFHLAALIAIPYSYHAPESYVHTNIVGTLNVLQAVRARGIARLVHTSTSEVYGTACYSPIDELHPLQGQSPYSASKIGADKLAEAFNLSFDVPVVTVRPFNTFGPRQSARAVVPTIITQCLVGETVRLGSLHPERDLNYVSNVVEGFLKAATVPIALGKTINLGSGYAISIEELATLIARLIGRSIVIESDQRRIRPVGSEVDRLLADNSRARDLLGWEPRVSLEQGLKDTIKWFEDNQGIYRPDVYIV